MEKLPIKLNELSTIMNLLIEKIQLLDSSVFSKQQKVQFTKEMVEVVENLRIFFEKAAASLNEENTKNFKENIERAFSQFEWNTCVAVNPYDFNKFSENGKSLISLILKLLGTKGCGILIIETYLKLCTKVLMEMNEKVENKGLTINKTNFKLLLDGFSAATNALKKYWHITFSLNQKNTIMLCLHQICKVLPFLLKMIELQNADLKKYALNILTKCLDVMLNAVHSEGNKKSNTLGQQFITQMDFCLYKLNELSNYSKDFPSFIEKANATVTVIKPVIDELLCLVMTVAHVLNFQVDFSAIVAGSQKVLREYSELTNEVKNENVPAIKLNAISVGESLCNLEHQVNTAVLKLVLEVFSSVNSPLKNILNTCRLDIAKANKASEDLNVLISDFDLEMDKIMQIGLFAMSCTTSLNRILRIQSCLASLESLETELIPSLTALYIDCSDKNKNNFQYLFDFWLNEITEMKNLIDSVLDPAGFCGVVKVQIKNLGLDFIEDSCSSSLCLNKLKYSLKQAVRYSRKLIRTLKTSMKDETNINEKTEDYLKKFQLAVQECEAVLDLLDEEQDTNKIIGQAVRRYNFLMQSLNKLSSHLFVLAADDENKSEQTESSTNSKVLSKMQIPQKNYYKLCELSEVSQTTCNVIPEILTPYLNTGILRSKKRNILYTSAKSDVSKVKAFTSVMNSKNLQKSITRRRTMETNKEQEDETNKPTLQAKYWDKTPTTSKRSRCCKPLTLSLELENTIDLEITTILENISHLSNSCNRSSQSSRVANAKEEIKKDVQKKNFRDVACGAEKGIDDTKPIYTSSGCCAKLDSEENGPGDNQQENSEDEKTFLGNKLRNSFLQTLNNLSCNDTLLVATDTEATSHVDSPDRLNDIKIVEEKINFLKNRMPCLLP